MKWSPLPSYEIVSEIPVLSEPDSSLVKHENLTPSLFFKIFYLFIHERHRGREREADT